MKKLFCDLCDKEVDRAIRVEVLDGEHPHCGSTVYKTIDVCLNCIDRLELRCHSNFDQLKFKTIFNSGNYNNTLKGK